MVKTVWMVALALRARLEPQVQLEPQGLRVRLAPQDRPELLEQPVPLGLRVLPELRVCRAHPAMTGKMAKMV